MNNSEYSQIDAMSVTHLLTLIYRAGRKPKDFLEPWYAEYDINSALLEVEQRLKVRIKDICEVYKNIPVYFILKKLGKSANNPLYLLLDINSQLVGNLSQVLRLTRSSIFEQSHIYFIILYVNKPYEPDVYLLLDQYLKTYQDDNYIDNYDDEDKNFIYSKLKAPFNRYSQYDWTFC